MQFRRLIISFFLTIISGAFIVSNVYAFPPLPSSFYGQVRVNGQSVPDGTVVRAIIGGKVYAQSLTQTYQGGSVYRIDIPGDDTSTTPIEGGREADIVQFEIGGVPATQTGVWHSGTNVLLDLSAASITPVQTPQVTLTFTRTSSQAATQAATIQPTFTKPASTVVIQATLTSLIPSNSPTIISINPPIGSTAPPSGSITPATTLTPALTQFPNPTEVPILASASKSAPNSIPTTNSSPNQTSLTMILGLIGAIGVVAVGGYVFLSSRKK